MKFSVLTFKPAPPHIRHNAGLRLVETEIDIPWSLSCCTPFVMFSYVQILHNPLFFMCCYFQILHNPVFFMFCYVQVLHDPFFFKYCYVQILYNELFLTFYYVQIYIIHYSLYFVRFNHCIIHYSGLDDAHIFHQSFPKDPCMN